MKLEDFTKEELIQVVKRFFFFKQDTIIRELITQRYKNKSEWALKRMDITSAKMQKETNRVKWLELNKEFDTASKEFDKITKWYEKAFAEVKKGGIDAL